MLYFETTGYNYSYKRCHDIVLWFVAKYLPRHKLDITINHRGLLREGVFGWCTVVDCDYRPRAFEIELHNRMDPIQYTQTLLHELWHVYQHVKRIVLCEDEAYKMEEVLFKNYNRIS